MSGVVRRIVLTNAATRVRSPIAATATPVSAAAAEQQHQYKNNQDQFHNKSPLLATALFAAHPIFQSADRILNLPAASLTVPLACSAASNTPGVLIQINNVRYRT